MLGELQQGISVWVVLVVPFLSLVAYRQVRDEVTLRLVVAYWVPPAVATVVGVLPAPWSILEAFPT